MAPYKQRLVTLYKILDFFEENPFEQKFCGMTKRDALCLVQFYLNEQGENISVLENINFLVQGKNFKKSFDSFIGSLKAAKDRIGDNIKKFDATSSTPSAAPPPLPLDQTMSQTINPPLLKSIVQEYENHIRETVGDDVTRERQARGQWASAVVADGMPFTKRWSKEKIKTTSGETTTKGEIVENTFKDILNNQLAEQRKKDRESVLLQQKTDLAASAVKISGDASVEKIITDIFDQPVHTVKQKVDPTTGQPIIGPDKNPVTEIEYTEERKIWDGFIFENPASLSKQPQDFSQAARENEIKKHYLQELQKRGVTQAQQIVDQLDARALTEVSFLKYFHSISTDPSLLDDARQEKIGGLFAGKMLAGAHQAVNAPSLDPIKKSSLISEAVQETYIELAADGFSLLHASDKIVAQKLQEKLEKKFQSRIFGKQGVTITPVAFDTEIAVETKELAAIQTARAISWDTGYHTIPIPGLVFMDEFQRAQIIGNDAIYQLLKTGKGIDNQTLSLAFRFTHKIDEHRPPSIEEKALLMAYLTKYQEIVQNRPALGWVIHKLADWHSMNSALPETFVRTRLGSLLFLPKMMALQYAKAFISAAASDISIVPYAFTYFAWSFVKGSVSLRIKGIYTSAIDKVFGKSFLKNIFYIKDAHGIAHVTLLHPLEAAKVVWTETWRKGVQWMVNKTVIWGARILGKEVLATAIGGPIGLALGGFWIIWDFLTPEWLKKALKFLLVGFTIGLLWLLQFLVGWGGVIGGLLGLIFPILGPLTPIIGTFLGMGVGSLWYFLTGSSAFAPGWVVSLFPHATGVGTAIGNFIGGVGNILGFGTGHALAAQAGTTAAVVSAVPAVASVSGAIAGIGFLWIGSWVPVSPQAVPGGLAATSFKVEKSVAPVNTSNCPEFSPGKKCKNAVTTDAGAEFEYTITIQSAPGKTISNIRIKDTVTILALGQCGLNIENACPKGTKVNKYEITPTIPDTSTITIPDATGKNAVEIKYRIKLNDSKYRNSVVMNLVEVSANGELGTNGSVFTIGTPPPSDCPVKLGQISCASLGSPLYPNRCQHGSDSYWSGTGTSACAYAIPYLTGTMSNSTRYANGTVCANRNLQPQREDYGFAADITPVINDMVFFPSIYGEELNWRRYGGIVSNGKDGSWGYSAYYEASGVDFSYKIYVTHIRKSDISDGGRSGTQLGTMCDKARGECTIGKHVHVEVVQIARLSGKQTTLRPEFLCSY